MRIVISAAVAALLGSAVAAEQAGAQDGVALEERQARHILLRSETDADDLLRRIAAGEDFVALCRAHSLDAGTKRTGGEIADWIRPGSWPGLDTALFGIEKPGGVAKAQSPLGWHLIQYVKSRNITVKKPDTPPAGKSERPAAQPKTPDTKPPEKAEAGDAAKTGAAAELRKRRQAARNNDLTWVFDVENRSYHPGEDIYFTIAVTNNATKILNVFHPDLWPLGLVARYRYSKDSALDLHAPGKGAEPEGGYYHDLAAGEKLERRFRLQDYAGKIEPWPLINVDWSGELFFLALARDHAEIARHAEFQNWQDRWYYYRSRKDTFALLPKYADGGRWYAGFFFGQSDVWVELRDPGPAGLMDFWTRQAVEGAYQRMPFGEGIEKQCLKVKAEGEGAAAKFKLPPDWTPAPLEPYSLAIPVEVGADGAVAGGGVWFLLGEPAPLQGKAISIGKVLNDLPLLDRIVEGKIDGRLTRKEVTAVDLYPESLLPERAKNRIAGKPVEPAVLPPEMRKPGTDTQPGVESQPRETSRPAPPPGLAPDLPVVELLVGEVPIKITLYEDHAPNAVANFIQLVDRSFYDGLTFHVRSDNAVNPGWIQGGSPSNTEMGRLDYCIKDEISPKLGHARGTVAMAGRNDGTPNSASCQFYICFAPQPQLDGKFTIIGGVTEGLEKLEKMTVPAAIQKARVLSRRAHDYVAETIPVTGS